jgi:endoglucanase
MSGAFDFELLAQICKVPGAPGFEKAVRELLKPLLVPYVDSLETDNMGNLYAIKKGKNADKRIMVAAHMDEIGFIVSHIDEKGFVYFQNLGGFDPKTHTAQRVIIHGQKDVVGVMASKPIHVMSQEERNKPATQKDYFIDTGLSVEELKTYIQVGDFVTRERDLIAMGDCVNGKSLDNRVSVYILLETLKKLKTENIPYDFYAVFTVQEEVGLRGAQTATQMVKPTWALGLDTTIAYDLPGAASYEVITKLGEGTAIKIMDASSICDVRMVAFLKQIAQKQNIKYQIDLMQAGGTDTANLQRMTSGGSIAGAISVPTRHLHQVVEMCHKNDIMHSIDLLYWAVKSIDTYDWTH